MPCTDAQRLANRANSQRSTGPKTAEGKASSRRNALKHGFTATDLDMDDRDQPSDQPAATEPPWQDWLGAQVARTMRQIDRLERVEAKLRDQAAWRALAVWEDDRQVEVEDLGANLGRDPARTVARLRQTPQGVDWLITRWGWLARAAEVEAAGWSEGQTRLAFDLLGIAEEGRVGSVCDSVADFDLHQPAQTPLGLARGMIARLRDHRDAVDEADEVAQSLAQADLTDTPTYELARLRRYEGSLHKRLAWLLTELRGQAGPPAAPPESSPPRNEANPAPIAAETKPIPANPVVTRLISAPDFPGPERASAPVNVATGGQPDLGERQSCRWPSF